VGYVRYNGTSPLRIPQIVYWR